MNLKKLTLFILLVWIPTLFMGLILSLFLRFVSKTPPVDPEVIPMIAGRVGVEPDRDAIYNYMANDAFEVGMTREEVVEVLDRIGPWVENVDILIEDEIMEHAIKGDKVFKRSEITLRENYRETIYFLEGNTARALGEWSFSYQYGKLVEFHPIHGL